MLSIGLDVHDRYYALCILDANGKVFKETQLRGSLQDLIDYLRQLPEAWSICYEVSCGYGHLFDLLAPLAKRVAVAHAGEVRLIFRAKQKNDRIDARKLATLLFLDQVPTVYVPSVDVRSWRNLITFRTRQIDRRTRVKNAIRALLRTHGIEAPRAGKLWSRRGRTALAQMTFLTETAVLQRDVLLDELNQAEASIRRVTRELDRIAEQHPGVILLRTIPGVGPRTAEAVVAWIDHPRRFRKNKKIGSYFGLVPCQDQSAGRNRLGHITQAGPTAVRRLLTEAAWQGIRRSPHLRAYFERVQHEDRTRRKIALVATSHYLARVMLAMLQNGEAWRHEAKGASKPKAA